MQIRFLVIDGMVVAVCCALLVVNLAFVLIIAIFYILKLQVMQNYIKIISNLQGGATKEAKVNAD